LSYNITDISKKIKINNTNAATKINKEETRNEYCTLDEYRITNIKDKYKVGLGIMRGYNTVTRPCGLYIIISEMVPRTLIQETRSISI